MKKKSLLIVSRTGKPVLSISVSAIIWAFFGLIAAVGLLAYFIPATAFHLSSDDLRFQQDLGRQNELLHSKIVSALQLLDRAKEQINRLGEKKAEVSAMLPAASGSSRSPNRAKGKPAPQVSLVAQVSHIDSAFSPYAAGIERGENPFERIPVFKPVSEATVIFRHFCTERDPFSGHKKKHQGIDIAAASGTPVIAAAAGTVSAARADAVWGKRIVVEHGNGFHTVYAHLGNMNVSGGKKVKRGDVIGTIGSSGYTTGPHIHYEIWYQGKAVDPEKFFFPKSAPAS